MICNQANRGWKLGLTELSYSIEIGKTYRIENGTVVSTTEGNGFNGTFRTHSLSSIAELCALQDGLNRHQCLIAGMSCIDADYGRLGHHTDRCHERTKDWFLEPYCHALVTCDVDRVAAPPDLETFMGTAADVAGLFFEMIPQLQQTALLVRPSSSNGVCYPDGSPAKKGGWHVHLIAPPGMRVVIMERLYAAFVKAGFGWIVVSKPNERTGIPSLLKRNPVDQALLPPNQPIYSGVPRVEPPLMLKRPACFAQEGCAVDPDWLPALERKDVEHLYDEMKQAPEVQAELETAIMQAAERRVAYGVADRERTVEETVVQVRKQVEDAQRGVLGPEVEIQLYRGPLVTVAQILAEPTRYDHRLTLTPGEPEYRDYSQTGIIYADERGAKLHTQAHGGTTYTLLGVDLGKLVANLTDEPAAPTRPLPPEDAKRQLRAALAPWPEQAFSLAVKATQGLGKTEEVLARVGEESELRFLFLAANLKQCEQNYAAYCKLFGGEGAVICRGRNAHDPDKEDALMCTQSERCERALAHGATNLSVDACGGCSDFSSCGYQKQVKRFQWKSTAPRVVFAAHDYAHYSMPGGWEPDAVVIDEVLRTGGVDEEITVPITDLALLDLTDPQSALIRHEADGEHICRLDPDGIRAHRYKSELLNAMIHGGVYYQLGDKWIVPKYREFVHGDKPVLVIDGTLRPALLRLQLKRSFEVVEIEAIRNLILIHVVGNDAGVVATKTAFTRGASTPVKDFLSTLPGDWALFTYKTVRAILGRDDDPNCGHFSGDIRGSNRFKGYNKALVYGRLQIPEEVALGRARVLAEANGLPAPTGGSEWVDREVQPLYRGTRTKKVKFLRHMDHIVRDIVESEREDEIEQAIDRLRTVWHEGEPKVAVVVNNLPPTIAPTITLAWEDVREGRAAPKAMHATFTGLIPASPKQGPSLRPDLWGSVDSAKAHFQSQLNPEWKDHFQKILVLPFGNRRRVEAYIRPADCSYTESYQKVLSWLPR